MAEIIVVKQNVQGEETWRYPGRLLRRNNHSVLIEAYFNRPDTSFNGMLLGEGDRFLEVYFNNRWYNIFQIHGRADGALKGWYCNVTRPAQFLSDRIDYIDLALDLLVFPDGRQLILDEAEFDELPLDGSTRRQAYNALLELQQLVDPISGFCVEDL